MALVGGTAGVPGDGAATEPDNLQRCDTAATPPAPWETGRLRCRPGSQR